MVGELGGGHGGGVGGDYGGVLAGTTAGVLAGTTALFGKTTRRAEERARMPERTWDGGKVEY